MDTTKTEVFSCKDEIRLAIARTIPFVISISIMGIVFGTIVITIDLQWWQGLLMSVSIFSGAAQFVGLELLPIAESAPAVLATTFFLSLRFFLYGLVLIEDVKDLPLRKRMFMAFFIVDETFISGKNRFVSGGPPLAKYAYFCTAAFMCYGSWIFGTSLGLLVGEELVAYNSYLRLEFLSYAAFLGMLVPHLRVRKKLIASILALLIYLGTWTLPYNLGIVVSCISAPLIVQGLIYRANKRAKS